MRVTLWGRTFIVGAVASSLLLALLGCTQSTGSSSSVPHTTPAPAAILILRAGAGPVRIEEGSQSFDSAWSVLDALGEYDRTEPDAWPEDPSGLTEPRTVDQYVTAAQGGVSSMAPGASRLVFVFETDTWLQFPKDATASQPLHEDASNEQGVPFREASTGGTEYHVRQVTLEWGESEPGFSALLRTESSLRIQDRVLTGAWLRTVDSGIQPVVDSFQEAMD